MVNNVDKLQSKNIYISIIIPLYNDPAGVKDTLVSIINQDFSKDKYEIIVVDNGSTDSTVDVVNNFKEKYPELLKLLIEGEIRSSYAARNKGIKNSKGDILAFVDADMMMQEDWLKRIANTFNNEDAVYIGYNVEITLDKKTVSGLYNKLTGFPVKTYIQNCHFVPTRCLLVRKTIFEKVRLFDLRLISSGDFEFGNRIFKKGHIQLFDFKSQLNILLVILFRNYLLNILG